MQEARKGNYMRTSLFAVLVLSCSLAACDGAEGEGSTRVETSEAQAAISIPANPDFTKPILVRTGSGEIITIDPKSPGEHTNITVAICTKKNDAKGDGAMTVGAENCHKDANDGETRCNVQFFQALTGAKKTLEDLGFSCNYTIFS